MDATLPLLETPAKPAAKNATAARKGKPAKTVAKGTKAGKGKKGLNTAAKGTAIELTAIKILEADGYKVHRCVRTGVKRGPLYISQSNDVFGCIDLVAKKKGERTRWIQVTAHSGIGQKKADLSEVPWDPLFDSVEIWRWVGGKHGRKDKRTGEVLDDLYFQLYHLDDAYQLDPANRVRPA